MTGERYTQGTLTAFAARHAVRSLDEWAPELVPFLAPGLRVLDVGCGPGSITTDVAERVKSGEVVGIDPLPSNVEAARELAAGRNIRNASFEVADGLDLPFADRVFDLVYSHTVLHYFHDPMRAIAEQRRVTKPGGWVAAAGVRDLGLVRRYPPCPAWERIEDAHALYADRQIGRPKSEELSLGQSQAARRCVGYFVDAGLSDLEVGVKTHRLLYPGSSEMEPSIYDALPWPNQDERISVCPATYRRDCDAMIEEGLIDEETVRQAMEEARAWYANPHAFHFYVMVFVAGRVQPSPS